MQDNFLPAQKTRLLAHLHWKNYLNRSLTSSVPVSSTYKKFNEWNVNKAKVCGERPSKQLDRNEQDEHNALNHSFVPPYKSLQKKFSQCQSSKSKLVYINEHQGIAAESLSTKVLLCGIPTNITNEALHQQYKNFNMTSVEWVFSPFCTSEMNNHKTFAYARFKNQDSVKNFLQNCHFLQKTNEYVIEFVNHGEESKLLLQVLVWSVEKDFLWFKGLQDFVVPNNIMVRISCLGGFVTANQIAEEAARKFGKVICCKLHAEENNGVLYPSGEGIIFFEDTKSKKMALREGIMEVKSSVFNTKVKFEQKDIPMELKLFYC